MTERQRRRVTGPGLSNDAMPQRLRDGLGLGVHLQLGVDALHVEGDGIYAAGEGGGCGLVAMPLESGVRGVAARVA